MSLTGPTGTYALAYEIVQAGPTGVTLSGTGMSYLDTRNSSGIFILPDESIASLKKVAL